MAMSVPKPVKPRLRNGTSPVKTSQIPSNSIPRFLFRLIGTPLSLHIVYTKNMSAQAAPCDAPMGHAAVQVSRRGSPACCCLTTFARISAVDKVISSSDARSYKPKLEATACQEADHGDEQS